MSNTRSLCIISWVFTVLFTASCVQQQHEPRCPPNYSGLLPHPHNCYKFLSCNRGATFIMNCGPGTAFNPKIKVCDWPYNVPLCKKHDSDSESDEHLTSGVGKIDVRMG